MKSNYYIILISLFLLNATTSILAMNQNFSPNTTMMVNELCSMRNSNVQQKIYPQSELRNALQLIENVPKEDINKTVFIFITDKTPDGFPTTPLMLAINHGLINCVISLIENGADPQFFTVYNKKKYFPEDGLELETETPTKPSNFFENTDHKYMTTIHATLLCARLTALEKQQSI